MRIESRRMIQVGVNTVDVPPPNPVAVPPPNILPVVFVAVPPKADVPVLPNPVPSRKYSSKWCIRDDPQTLLSRRCAMRRRYSRYEGSWPTRILGCVVGTKSSKCALLLIAVLAEASSTEPKARHDNYFLSDRRASFCMQWLSLNCKTSDRRAQNLDAGNAL